MQGHTQVCTHCQSTQPQTLQACLRVGQATPVTDSTSMPPGRASYSNTPATDSASMPPGRASYSITPATDSTSTPPGRVRRQDQAPGKTCQHKVLFTQGSAQIFDDDR
eukprot:908872-Rhodomonas_salina.1